MQKGISYMKRPLAVLTKGVMGCSELGKTHFWKTLYIQSAEGEQRRAQISSLDNLYKS